MYSGAVKALFRTESQGNVTCVTHEWWMVPGCRSSAAWKAGHRHKGGLRSTADTKEMLSGMQEEAASKALWCQRTPLEQGIW